MTQKAYSALKGHFESLQLTPNPVPSAFFQHGWGCFEEYSGIRWFGCIAAGRK